MNLDDAYKKVSEYIYDIDQWNWNPNILRSVDEILPYDEHFNLQKEIAAVKKVAKDYLEHKEEIKKMIEHMKLIYPKAQKYTIDWIFTQ